MFIQGLATICLDTQQLENVTYDAAEQRFQLNHFNGNIIHAVKNPLQRLQAMPCLRKVDLLFIFL